MVDKETKEKILKISASTLDRLLSKEKAKMRLKGRTRTKPGTLLKHQIPIRTFTDWDESRPGFVEIDLVSHDGGMQGEIMPKHLMLLMYTQVGQRLRQWK